MFVRDGFNYDTGAVSLETGLACADKSLAVQSSKDEADINVLVRRFGVTGLMPVGVRAPIFQDFDGVFDFQSAMNAVLAAEAAFAAVPAEVRRRFGNDPQQFVAFCSDESNRDELIKLGLVVPEKASPAPAGESGSGGNPQANG